VSHAETSATLAAAAAAAADDVCHIVQEVDSSEVHV